MLFGRGCLEGGAGARPQSVDCARGGCFAKQVGFGIVHTLATTRARSQGRVFFSVARKMGEPRALASEGVSVHASASRQMILDSPSTPSTGAHSDHAPCPDENVLVAFLEHELPGEQAEDIERHLDQCPACRSVAADWARDFAREAAHSGALGQTSDVDRDGDTLAPGTTVGRYVVLNRIGVGSHGVVHLAYDPILERQVALKLLKRGLSTAWATADARSGQGRLVREARAMARLSHPNIAAVHDLGDHDGRVFIVMDYAQGVTLRRWLALATRTWEQVLEVFIQAARGLAAAHDAGIIHRDFKPDNVLVDGKGVVRVTDFGLAHASGTPHDTAGPGEPFRDPPASTTDHMILGTPAYMAPEQHAGQPADARSDVFAFCAALYEALFGDRPFPAPTMQGLVEQKSAGRTLDPATHALVPSWLTRGIERGLSADPNQRFQSMQELLRALTKADAASAERSKPKQRLLTWLLIAAVVAAIPSIAVVAWRLGSHAEPAVQAWGVHDSQSSTPTFAMPPGLGTFAAPPAGSRPMFNGGLQSFLSVSAEEADWHGRGWLPWFTLVRFDGLESQSFLEAALQRCHPAGMAACTETQWQRACEVDHSVGTRETWTATLGDWGKVVLRGGGEGCSRRALVSLSSRAARPVACCSPAPLLTGSTEAARKRVAQLLSGWEMVLNHLGLPAAQMWFDDEVEWRESGTIARTKAMELLREWRVGTTDLWVAHEACTVEEKPAEELVVATCQRREYANGRLADLTTRYGWRHPQGGMRMFHDETRGVPGVADKSR